jgi:hypothetical protein
MMANSNYGHTNPDVGIKPNRQILSFINTANSVYSSAAMTTKAFSTESVNPPQKGADLYNYGTEQS